MASYSRKSCSSCAILLPQPEMCRREVTPMSVRGHPLPSRMKWFCHHCAPPNFHDIQRAEYEQAKVDKDAAIYNEKKRLWQEEQERRRLANLAKRKEAAKQQNEADELQNPYSDRSTEDQTLDLSSIKKTSMIEGSHQPIPRYNSLFLIFFVFMLIVSAVIGWLALS
jgi:hypothetical protein